MSRNQLYTVYYRSGDDGVQRFIDVFARDKYEAWEKAYFEAIPARESVCPYSAWVSSITYNNGKQHVFNTSEGNPY